MSTTPSRAYGKVYLVGAGPGDPGLLTVRGKACLQAADCVVYDALVNPALLALAPRAELVYAGKQAGRHSLPQGDINALLHTLAGRHAHIVRLKGGDPFVFGRGGEEALALAAAGIPFEVVPGVTSGIAVPAYAGIPVTHRGLARGVTFVTGHTDEQGRFLLEAADLPKRGTVVVYMGVRSLPAMVRVLRESGRGGDTPAALLASGTYATQRVLVSDLEHIVARAQEEGIAAPALLIVGEVISLRDTLSWFEKRPLFGKRILLTHSRRDHDALAEGLAALGAEVMVMPTVAFQALECDDALPGIVDSEWLLLTSANAVTHLFEALRAAGRDFRALAGVRLLTVGRSATQALEARHARPDATLDNHEPERVTAALRAAGAQPGDRLAILRSDLTRRALAQALRDDGYSVAELSAYRAAPPVAVGTEEALLAFAPQMVVFTNSAAVRNLCATLSPERLVELLRGTQVASIGTVTSTALQEMGIGVDVEPPEPTIAQLIERIAAWGHQA